MLSSFRVPRTTGHGSHEFCSTNRRTRIEVQVVCLEYARLGGKKGQRNFLLAALAGKGGRKRRSTLWVKTSSVPWYGVVVHGEPAD